MTKDDILALLGKQMQVRVTSNEKVEETLETAGENDIVLAPDGLYRHDLELEFTDTNGKVCTILTSVYFCRKEAYTDAADILGKLPYQNVCAMNGRVVVLTKALISGTAIYSISENGTVILSTQSIPTIKSDTVTEV